MRFSIKQAMQGNEIEANENEIITLAGERARTIIIIMIPFLMMHIMYRWRRERKDSIEAS